MELSKLPSEEKKWIDTSKDYLYQDLNPNMKMIDLIYEQNKNHMNDIAINFLGQKITFEEFFTNIDKVARTLKKHGISEGDVLPFIVATVPEAAYLLYAANTIGATACMIDPRLNEYRILNDIGMTNAELLISLRNAAKAIKNVKDVTKVNEIVMLSALNSMNNPILKSMANINDYVKGNFAKDAEGWKKFIKTGKNVEVRPSEFLENTGAAVVFTGGTTGVHKGVVLSNEALNTTVLEHRYLIDGVERGEKFLDILPPFIAYGLTSLHLSFSYGLETILNPVPDPALFGKQISDSHAAIAFGGPIHWEAITHDPNVSKYDFSNLKFPVSGGEKLNVETAKRIDKTLFSCGSKSGIYDGYGASECCGVFSLYQPSKNTDGTVGYPLRFNDMKIIDPETSDELSYNQHGEICISGPSIMLEYFKNPEETEKVFFEDEAGEKWLHTGDLGYINEKGELIITGRLKRIFVCGVNKVYPPEMENLIMNFPEVRKCVVTGVSDPELRTVPKVHLILEDLNVDLENLYRRIHDAVSEKIANEVAPRYYQVDDDFLYTGSGKIDYKRMEEIDNLEAKDIKTLNKKF